VLLNKVYIYFSFVLILKLYYANISLYKNHIKISYKNHIKII